MKLAFINPPRIGKKKLAVESEDCCWGIGPLVLPSMLLAAASEAQKMGHQVAFIDWAIDTPGEYGGFSPDIVIHPLAWQWWDKIESSMGFWCEDTPRIVLATPPGYLHRYLEGSGAELIFRGNVEGYVSRIPTDGGKCWADVYSLRVGGYLALNMIQTLDQLAPIDYSLVPPDYWPHYKAAIYQVTRGCPYRCTFCVWGGSTCTDRTFKTRPPDLVADNLQELYEISSRYRNGSPIPLYLLSAQLTTDQEWIEKFHQGRMGDTSNPRPLYPFQSNVNFADMTDDGLRLLREAGLSSAGASLDGAAPSILRLMRKPYTMEKAIDGMLLMKKYRLLRRCRVRYGVGETQEDVDSAIEWAQKIKGAGIQKLQVNIASIIHYVGTMIGDVPKYDLAPLPGKGPKRLIMAHPPDWKPYIETCRSMGWAVRVGPRK